MQHAHTSKIFTSSPKMKPDLPDLSLVTNRLTAERFCAVDTIWMASQQPAQSFLGKSWD